MNFCSNTVYLSRFDQILCSLVYSCLNAFAGIIVFTHSLIKSLSNMLQNPKTDSIKFTKMHLRLGHRPRRRWKNSRLSLRLLVNCGLPPPQAPVDLSMLDITAPKLRNSGSAAELKLIQWYRPRSLPKIIGLNGSKVAALRTDWKWIGCYIGSKDCAPASSGK